MIGLLMATPFRRTVVVAVVASLLGMALAFVFTVVFGRAAWRELLLGWLVAVLNGVVHAWINRKAVGSGAHEFLRWGIVMNALRLTAVLVTLLGVCFLTSLRTAPFAVTVVGCTMLFLTANAIALAREGESGCKT